MNERIESVSHEAEPGEHRRLLLELERSGQYVFHGSPADIGTLAPRQARTFKDGVMVTDGTPCVAATPYADIAIFRALTNRVLPDTNSRSSFGVSDGSLHFEISTSLLEAIRNEHATGHVFVLDKNAFTPRNEMEYRRDSETTPFRTVQVTADDLPPHITVFEDSWAG